MTSKGHINFSKSNVGILEFFPDFPFPLTYDALRTFFFFKILRTHVQKILEARYRTIIFVLKKNSILARFATTVNRSDFWKKYGTSGEEQFSWKSDVNLAYSLAHSLSHSNALSYRRKHGSRSSCCTLWFALLSMSSPRLLRESRAPQKTLKVTGDRSTHTHITFHIITLLATTRIKEHTTRAFFGGENIGKFFCIKNELYL